MSDRRRPVPPEVIGAIIKDIRDLGPAKPNAATNGQEQRFEPTLRTVATFGHLEEPKPQRQRADNGFKPFVNEAEWMQSGAFHEWVEANLPSSLKSLLTKVRNAEQTGPGTVGQHPRRRGRQG